MADEIDFFAERKFRVMSTEQTVIILVVALIVIALIAIGIWLYQGRRRSIQLRSRFGSEYERAVRQYGGRRRAEADLAAREERVRQLHIVSLSPAEAARFRDAWQRVQSEFVDDPKMAVAEADLQIRSLMEKRGYPVGDFEQRAADISVDYPTVVDNYRLAHHIAIRSEQGMADTEELRKALVHYRALFDELLETSRSEPKEARSYEIREQRQ